MRSSEAMDGGRQERDATETKKMDGGHLCRRKMIAKQDILEKEVVADLRGTQRMNVNSLRNQLSVDIQASFFRLVKGHFKPPHYHARMPSFKSTAYLYRRSTLVIKSLLVELQRGTSLIFAY